MALQGALETFKLDEVLRLLGTSEKSGLLTLTGDRGVGRVWVERGRITQTEIDVDTNFVLDEADAVFHMLRFTAGDFLFDDGDEATASGEVSLAMDEVLDEAQARLDEWRDIVGTITGLESQVTLVATIDAEVTVDPAAWERLALVGSGVTIREMGVQLAEAELHTMRAVKELVERGLVDIDDTPAPLASDLATIEPADVVESVTPFIAEPVEETAVVDQGQSVTPFIAEPVEETAPLVSAEPVEETAPLVSAEPAPLSEAIFGRPESTEPYEPPVDVPESWQTAAPASAWDTPAVDPSPAVETGASTPEPWDSPQDTPATPASWESATEPDWPAADSSAAPAVDPYAATPAEPQTWPEPVSADSEASLAPPAPEVWTPPAAETSVDEWPEPIGEGAEAWNGQPLDHRTDATVAPAAGSIAHEWDAPPPPVDTGIESLYDTDDDYDTYADANTGAIEYGDGAFDQAAEALGWGSEVDNSPEGFWGEPVTAEAAPVPSSVGTEEASEMARRLAELSPAAARAVAQAARATTPEEREAAIAAAEAEDASVDRSLLLRFLGSFDG